jgi:hypothetical protein
MSFVTAQPDVMVAAAGNLAGSGATMAAQNGAAAGPTTGVVSPAADIVSAMTAAHFVMNAQYYQLIAAQAAAVHEQLVSTLRSGAGAYALTEDANDAAAH